MKLPPITNATLTRVQAGGGAEDYEASSTGGTDKWTGAETVFVNDAQISDDTGRDSSIVTQRSIVVDETLPVTWERGDTVTYTYRGATKTGTVEDVKTTAAPGLLGVVRLVLRRT